MGRPALWADYKVDPVLGAGDLIRQLPVPEYRISKNVSGARNVVILVL